MPTTRRSIVSTVALIFLLAGCRLPGQDGDFVDGEIYRIAPDGTGLLRLTDDPGYDHFPAWSPDGTRLVFTGGGGSDVYLMNNDGTSRTQLTDTPEADFFPAWSPDGSWIAFASSGNDPAGRPGVPILYVVRPDGSELRRLDIAPPGPLDGRFGPGCDQRPTWSPDSVWILFCRWEAGGPMLNTIRPDGTGLRRLTDPSRPAGLADWSPDGRQIAFASSSTQPGAAGVYVMNADGSDVRHLSSLIVDVNYAPAWSPDGQALAVAGFQYKSGTGYDVWLIAADGSGMTNLTRSSEPEYMAAWAPDGGSLAVVRAARDGKTDLYLVPVDGSASQRLTESDMPVSGFPSWSPDGASIAFDAQSGDGSSGE